jgi:two-component system, NtrC family, sensor kinase
LRTISPALIRPVMLVGGIGGAALIFALLILVVTSWQALVLVGPVRDHVHHLGEIHDAARQAQQLLVRHLSNEQPPSDAEIEKIQAGLTKLIEQDRNLDPSTPSRLAEARDALDTFRTDPRGALLQALAETWEILLRESKAEAALIDEMHAYARWENTAAIAALVGLPLLAGLAFFVLRDRILNSLDRLSALLDRLGRREFAPATIEGTDSELRPVLESYNVLVGRLEKAEAENERRRGQLEAQVRAATRTMLRQGRELAEADRLAAIGETSARIAHELRNPLAGIELGLRNLRVDCELAGGAPDKSFYERLDPMVDELQRMSRLLTSLLEQGRRSPEPAVKTDVSTCVRETLVLARYQTSESIKIETTIPDDINCILPRDALRQVVFNLVLNAVQAIGQTVGTVKVQLRKGDDAVILYIADDGPGFPEDILTLGPRIFVTRRTGGSGLGLPTVRRLLEQLGGRMELANPAEGGALVTVTFPCRITNA